MIKDIHHAIEVQTRRRKSGKKGRAKAVRRWASRELGTAIESCRLLTVDARIKLDGNFKGCRQFDEVHK